jgi:Zn-dependent M16 (insulinase) family peptidase
MPKPTLLSGVLLMTMPFGLARPSPAAAEFADLGPGQRIGAFLVEAVYENETGKAIGARFRHDPTRFVLDVLRIQSIPQAFMWVNSPPPSDQGEPHTLEHLLLGKGTKGRYVASLEDMSLGRSSAFTQQRRTCYHFSTEAGKDVFFGLFEAKLDAMLNPNFSDEEIRREVCHVGIVEKEGGKLWLEEKGTVYNEMVSSFERPWGNLFFAVEHLLYGETHPLAMSSGGEPAAIREMTPEDIRTFHAGTHHLNNMGAAVSIGDGVPLDECLSRIGDLFTRVEPEAKPGEDPASLWDRLPAPRPAPEGSIRLAHFPHQSGNEPGLMVFAWPAVREMDARSRYLLGLFMNLLAEGQTASLYRRFIDSQTRVMDIGASSVFSWIESQPGQAVFVGFDSVDPAACAEDSVRKVRSLILDEIRSVAGFAEGSPELEAFNRRALNQVTKDRRDVRVFLNSPPRFGYRGTGTAWIDHLQDLHRKGGFRRNLAQVDELAAAEALIAEGANFWTEYIDAWRLLDVPYGGATTGDPSLLETSEREREERIRKHVDDLRTAFGGASDEEAVARFRERYDANTAVIEAEAATIGMPRFVQEPPLSLDDQLRYETDRLPGGGALVASSFENITSGTVGFAFSLNVVPEGQLVYVPALPTVFRNIGVIRDGIPVPYDGFDELLRREILSLNAYMSVNYRTERAELVLRGSGSEQSETVRALEWLETALYHPDLRPENLPRIRDAVDLELKEARNRMRGSEESWVNNPVNAFWKQRNPVLLQADCFLTQVHSLHRLRWLLKDAGGQIDGFRRFVDAFARWAEAADREAVAALLASIAGGEENDVADLASMEGGLRDLVQDAAKDLEQSLPEIPDGSLAADLRYLCGQMAEDLALDPAAVLEDVEDLLGTLRRRDNVRAFVISNSEDRRAVMPRIVAVAAGLDPAPSVRQSYPDAPLITSRVEGRNGGTHGSPFIALVNENTRSGVHLHTADCASYETTDKEALLRFLSARLYGGGGAHSMFMKTWGAGLAYSNGLRSSESNGRLIYYAERCPDLPQTLQFVIGELEKAPHDPSLAEYAVAQAFGGNRSGSRYEQRGEAMADDLADGLTPDVVAAFRRGILDLRRDPGLYDKLHALMEDIYGEVLPGYGPSSEEAAARANAVYFVIGPRKQLESWESYLETVEPGSDLVRIYPRDYWQPRPVKGL